MARARKGTLVLRKTPHLLGKLLINGIADIDNRCCNLINGVECGIAYVKVQFAEMARVETGKKLSEELLISWLLRNQLQDFGINAALEVPYVSSKEKCDLIVTFTPKSIAAIEVKLATKKWISCEGLASTNSVFKAYLLGDKSHRGTAHDFDKLERSLWPPKTLLGVLLIGFDTFAAPMDDRILELEKTKQLKKRGWTLTSHKAWPDRKNSEYRIGVWFWTKWTG